jgi:hypothetical protein
MALSFASWNKLNHLRCVNFRRTQIQIQIEIGSIKKTLFFVEEHEGARSWHGAAN